MTKLTRKIAAVLMVLVASTSAYGQAGGSAVPFLLISPDARASGMGELGTSTADNVYAQY